jgi:hypothetical protein
VVYSFYVCELHLEFETYFGLISLQQVQGLFLYHLSGPAYSASDLHYKIFTVLIYDCNDSTIIIYDCNDSGLCYKL